MLTYGDGVSDIKLEKLIEIHKVSKKLVTLTSIQLPGKFGNLDINENGEVLRFIENEQEVSDLLAQYGFKKIIAEKLSYAEQIAIFSKSLFFLKRNILSVLMGLDLPTSSSCLKTLQF